MSSSCFCFFTFFFCKPKLRRDKSAWRKWRWKTKEGHWMAIQAKPTDRCIFIKCLWFCCSLTFSRIFSFSSCSTSIWKRTTADSSLYNFWIWIYFIHIDIMDDLNKNDTLFSWTPNFAYASAIWGLITSSWRAEDNRALLGSLTVKLPKSTDILYANIGHESSWAGKL